RIDVNIKALWETRDDKYDVELLPGDFILVPMKTLKVFVTGHANNPGAYTFMKGNTVNDYLLLAGGIEENVGDPNGIWFMDDKGNRTKVELTTIVEPETNIYISKTVLKRSDQFVQNLLITTGWVTAIIGVINIVWEFVERF
ncbi:MAG: ligand-binding protein, partial [Bacillota bacterium]